ncbi:5-methylcytosine-specific restriction endonuclease McrA [Pontibacter ummariensis]|uniref:5-methylcytosine-specific restriction endonuclease McrA n=1 Tax=Pontibacter ummariensis TaxID=1610492 RepID=A0A239FBX5_9BACT|nr:HNH endonuclease [Pontibacter ummariensis]PRY12332.1 5-methylcytosine-specific restriction endonuclease McrA [Pontibacter ummariensis]SNS54221.1 5-methylcytosine-specific restriction endonuclease McrA [Pontibacter ummariensis]
MKDKVLILNQDFSAIAVCSVQKAFLLVFLEKAEMVSKASNAFLHTVSMTYPVPSVIRLQRYVRVPYYGIALSRHNVMRRDSYSCQYCGAVKNLTLDHLLPRSRGGETKWQNLVTACSRCNSRKGDRTPEEAGLKLIRKPSRPSLKTFLQLHLNHSNQDWRVYLGVEN